MATTVVADTLNREALTLPAPQLAAWLQEHLGQKLAAYAVGLRDPKMIGRYSAGKAAPRPLVLHRMQTTYEAARTLHEAFGDTTARSWFFGSNRTLGDRAPATVLANATKPGDFDLVMPAVRAFVAGDPS
ncbi:hypothetical protein [Patulibacter americanus]|uniref:hypothetical protein n=1 Tax=Patulibacter americanus TaxID=588672 RepID=UPI0003B79E2D|nr:hypothetical protein [Patulibacter americanus]